MAPADVPYPNPAQPAGPPTIAPTLSRRLDIDDLTWVDVADIVWLATAMRRAVQPHNTPDQVLTQENEDDMALENAIMCAPSGPYLSRAVA